MFSSAVGKLLLSAMVKVTAWQPVSDSVAGRNKSASSRFPGRRSEALKTLFFNFFSGSDCHKAHFFAKKYMHCWKNVFFRILLQTAAKSKIHIFPKKLIGPFSKLDIFKMSIFGKPLLLSFLDFYKVFICSLEFSYYILFM